MANRPFNPTPLSGDLCRAVVENSVDGLLVIDVTGVVRMANPAAISMFASKTDRLLGLELGTPAIHEPVELILPDAKASVTVEMRSTEILWKGQTASLACLRDVTHRKEAADALMRQAAELRRRNESLVSFNRAAVGRELRMIELKREVNELCQRVGEPLRYRLPADVITATVSSEGAG